MEWKTTFTLNISGWSIDCQMIGRDMAYFKELARSVQHRDFIAKSVLFDYTAKREGNTANQTMTTLENKFVAYNMLQSRIYQRLYYR